jgi:hypothetical protein
LVQTVLLQDKGFKHANARIEQLRAHAAALSHAGFLILDVRCELKRTPPSRKKSGRRV